MEDYGRNTNFFLESYSPGGLASFFDSFYDPREVDKVYLVTGTLGAVSSILIKAVADKLCENGFKAQKISNALCSNQLDAVYFEGAGACMVNGGENGKVTQSFPVAVERTVSLTDTVNREAIEQNSPEIKKLFCEESGAKKRAVGFLSAAGTMLNDTRALAKRYTDFDKIARFASRFARREFPVIPGRKGREYKRFLSSVTYKGIESYSGVCEALCDEYHVFSDPYGAASEYLAGLLKSYALASGYDVVSCYCPMSNGISTEHLIIPSLRKCFYCENDYHPAGFTNVRRISVNRFTDMKALSEHKKRIAFNRRAANEMFAGAVKLFADAENARNKLRLIYLSCTDGAKLNRIAEKTAEEIIFSSDQ